MDNSKQTEEKKIFASGRRTMMAGTLMTLFTCIYFVSAIMLDSTGEKAIGKLSNAATNCSPGKSCWTSKMEFTTKDGEQITFYPMILPMLFDLDSGLSGRPYAEYGNYEIRYLENYPQIAKVKLVFHLEKAGKAGWIFLGLFLMIMGKLFSRPNKPIVIDLSYLRK